MKTRKISGIKELNGYDILVAGGGPSGFCAAVEAARAGAKVLLVEATGMLGGMAIVFQINNFIIFLKNYQREVEGPQNFSVFS
jgi:heterodisulfide reductase subunit A-like polyferredoxin